MEITIRKIQRKGKSLAFKPNARSGYLFTIDSAQPKLSDFQASLISIKPQRDRNYGSFWTPDFCYIGTLLAQYGQVSLLDMISDDGNISMLDFNNNFPEKKWYWYKKAKSQNIAMQTYFIGVRATASIITYYYQLQKASQIKEAEIFYEQYLMPLGVAKLLADADSSIVSDEDYLYEIVLSANDCIVKAKRVSSGIDKKNKQPVKSNSVIEKKLVPKESFDNKTDIGKKVESHSINLPSLKTRKPNIDITNSAAEVSNAESTDRKISPHKLPKLTDKGE